mgnify:CR=1 FL=1
MRTVRQKGIDAGYGHDELLGVVSGFPAFGACFTLLFLIWHRHYVSAHK